MELDDKIKKYLFDINESIQGIEEYLGNKTTFEDFQKSKILRRATERELEIIGEALGRIIKIHPNFPISNARKIVNTRNFVIHDYDKVDEVAIWGILIKYLPILKTEVQLLISSK
jgi:uncharacterized protein with HEPN domain